ncbi:hypothetical protein Tco_1520170, partial [Tanacetum coccineum]
MDSIISLGQKNTLAEYMILSGADNRPPMLDKDLYDTTSLQHLSVFLQQSSTSTTVSTITTWINSTQLTLLISLSITNSIQSFIHSTITYISVSNESSNLNRSTSFAVPVAMLLVQGEILQVDRQELLNATTANVKDIWQGNALSLSYQGMQHDPGIPAGQAQTIIPHNATFQTKDLDTYDSEFDDLSTTQAVLMTNISNYGSDIISEVVQIVLWYLDSGCSKHMIENRSQLMNFVSKFLGTVRFGNDEIARIMGYGDYQLGNVVISRVYYVEGLGHNLVSVSQFCDADLEVAFRKNTCFIRNLEGVDL